MTRRSILRSISAVLALGIPAKLLAALPRKFGHIAARDCLGRQFRMTVDGMDVTNVAFEANDVEGWVRCYRWQGYPNPPGSQPKLVIDRMRLHENVSIAKSVKRDDGTVTIEFVQDVPKDIILRITLRGHVVIEELS